MEQGTACPPEDHVDDGVAVHGIAHGLADVDILEGGGGEVAAQGDVVVGLVADDVQIRLFLRRGNVGGGQACKVDLPGAEGGQPGGFIADEEVGDAVKLDPVGVPVVGELGDGHVVVGQPLPQGKGAGAAVRAHQIAVFLDHVLIHDSTVVAGQGAEESGVGLSQRELDGIGVQGLHSGDTAVIAGLAAQRADVAGLSFAQDSVKGIY